MNQVIQKNQTKSKARGGARPNAGRKKSAITVKTREIAEQAIADAPPGGTPLEVMLKIMNIMVKQADKALESNDPDEQKAAIKLYERATASASAAAPYIHPRLAAIEHTGKDGKDLAGPVLNLTLSQ